MVEFALGATVALAVMILGVQFAIIGQAALAVSQGSSAIARYVAINSAALGTTNGSVKGSALPAAASNLLSPTIKTNGGADLTITVASFTGTGAKESNPPVASVDRVVISLSYDAKAGGKIVLPTKTLLGLTFPTTLASSASQMYE
ncbi:MAG: hypothetical protein ACREQH_11200 [Candidatus Binatus sp.]